MIESIWVWFLERWARQRGKTSHCLMGSSKSILNYGGGDFDLNLLSTTPCLQIESKIAWRLCTAALLFLFSGDCRAKLGDIRSMLADVHRRILRPNRLCRRQTKQTRLEFLDDVLVVRRPIIAICKVLFRGASLDLQDVFESFKGSLVVLLDLQHLPELLLSLIVLLALHVDLSKAQLRRNITLLQSQCLFVVRLGSFEPFESSVSWT